MVVPSSTPFNFPPQATIEAAVAAAEIVTTNEAFMGGLARMKGMLASSVPITKYAYFRWIDERESITRHTAAHVAAPGVAQSLARERALCVSVGRTGVAGRARLPCHVPSSTARLADGGRLTAWSIVDTGTIETA
jgi:hypothetical protein